MGSFRFGGPTVVENPGMQFAQIKPEVRGAEKSLDAVGSAFGFSPQTSPVKEIPSNGDLSGEDLNGWAGLGDVSFSPLGSAKNAMPLTVFPNPRVVTGSAISQYGQVTPPMEISPSYPSPQKTTLEANADPPSKPPRRQRKTQSTNNISLAQPQDAAPRRRRTISSRSSAANSNGSADEKRNKFLERNRVAASKCRQKKKEWTESLEAEHRNQQSLRRMLIEQKDSAQQEILYLKNMLLAHADCHHPDLDHWLRSTASNITQPDSEATDQAEGQPGEGLSVDFDSFDTQMYNSMSPCDPIYRSPDSAEAPQQNDPELALIEQNLVGSLTQEEIS